MKHTPKEEEIREDFNKKYPHGGLEYKNKIVQTEVVDYILKIRREAIAEEREKVFWIGYDEGVSKQIDKKYLSPDEINEIFNHLTQE